MPATVAFALCLGVSACGSSGKVGSPSTTAPTPTVVGTAPTPTVIGAVPASTVPVTPPAPTTSVTPPTGTATPTGGQPKVGTTAKTCEAFRTLYADLAAHSSRLPVVAEALLRAAVAGDQRPGGPTLLSDADHVIAYVSNPGSPSGSSAQGAPVQKMRHDCSV